MLICGGSEAEERRQNSTKLSEPPPLEEMSKIALFDCIETN